MTQIGQAVERVSGPAKVTGAAKFAAEFEQPRLAYAVMVTSTVPRATIASMDTHAAEHAPGVLRVLTPFNAPRLPGASGPPTGRVLSVLQDAEVHYNNQPIAVVVAETLNQALFAAARVRTSYAAKPAMLDFKAGFATARPGSHGKDPADLSEGDFGAALRAAEVTVDNVYTTPMQNHNPMEPHATMAVWTGDSLTLHDATQHVSGSRQILATVFGLPADNVRVECPYTGGGFGCKGSTWSHVVLAAMAARETQRPVRLSLERPQMFGPVGGRPQTYQHLVLGAKRDGTLTAIRHDCYSHTSEIEDFTEPSSVVTRMLYAAPGITTKQRLVSMNVGTPTFQRAPGEATGTFALEIAMDELAEKLAMDPIALRLKNYAERDASVEKPFSSKHLRECYTQGAERFDWKQRTAQTRARRDGNELIGLGMATASYPANRSSARALVRFETNGRITVASGTQELGTGTYTIMAQVAAAELGVPISLIDAKLGDTRYPRAPVSGGSQSAASVMPAVQEAARQAKARVFALAAQTAASPFFRAAADDLQLGDGVISLRSSPRTTATLESLLAIAGGRPLEVTIESKPGPGDEQYSTHSFGAVFAEVAVDATLGMARVRRMLGVYDIGTLLTGKAGPSQLVGGIVWGISLALHEATHLDPATGRPVNNNLAEYHVPVNLDIGTIDVLTLGIPDETFNPLGARGIGEIGITGSAAAVANAIYNATGKRIRQAPITPDKLLA